MSRINVDLEAFTDPRFERLAQLLSLADADHARSKMEWLWLDCTTRGEIALPQWLVEKRLGPQGPTALIESELARWASGRGDSKTRKLYIRGARGRTEWLTKNREQSSNGGKARAQKASRVAGRFTSRVADETTSAPAPAPAPAPVLTLVTDAPAEPARKPKKRPAAKGPIPDDWQPKESHRVKAASLNLDCDAEAESFTNHHRSKGNVFVDHDAAFHTWLGNALRFGGRQQSFGHNNQAAPRRVVKEIE